MIKIVTDSTAYVTKEYADKHDISVIPLTITTKTKSYPEGMPGSFDDIFESMLTDGDTSKSSQPAPEKFEKAFEKILNDNNEVICITISSSLSGTYNSALLAAKNFDGQNITVIDSKSCAQLMLILVEKAVSMAEEGKSRDEIEKVLNVMREEGEEVFVPVTLKHLIRGGRIGGVQAIIGSLLHVKPLLGFSNGVLSCKRKVIGMMKAINEIVSEIPKTAKYIYVIHIYKSNFFDRLFNKIKEKFPDLNIKTGEVGPVVGVHVGPGSIGIAYC